MELKKTIFFMTFLLLIGFVSSAPPVTTVQEFPEGYKIVESPHEYLKQNEDYQYNFFVYNGSTGILLNNDTISCNFLLANSSGEVIFTNEPEYFSDGHWGINILGGNFSQSGSYPYGVNCQDGNGGALSGVFKVTPTGESAEYIGGLSTAIIYFYAILGTCFLFLGFMFLRNKTIWVKYTGLFLMIVGFTFFYYDLHLTNLYAQTIAINSGAGNITSGAFRMIVGFLKLAPYIVAGIIAFMSVKVLRKGIKKSKNSDGWDNNAY